MSKAARYYRLHGSVPKVEPTRHFNYNVVIGVVALDIQGALKAAWAKYPNAHIYQVIQGGIVDAMVVGLDVVEVEP